MRTSHRCRGSQVLAGGRCAGRLSTGVFRRRPGRQLQVGRRHRADDRGGGATTAWGRPEGEVQDPQPSGVEWCRRSVTLAAPDSRSSRPPARPPGHLQDQGADVAAQRGSRSRDYADVRSFALSHSRIGVGDLAPAAVDGQRVATALELLELGHGGGVAVLLQRRPGDDVGTVWSAVPEISSSGPRSALSVSTFGLRVHDEVRRGGLEERSGRRGDGPRSYSSSDSSSLTRVAEAVAELLLR